MKPKFKDLVIENLRSVTTIDLTIKSVVFLEKIFWTSIGIIGTLFAIYFFSIQIQTWKENPTIVTKGHIGPVHLIRLLLRSPLRPSLRPPFWYKTPF